MSPLVGAVLAVGVIAHGLTAYFVWRVCQLIKHDTTEAWASTLQEVQEARSVAVNAADRASRFRRVRHGTR